MVTGSGQVVEKKLEECESKSLKFGLREAEKLRSRFFIAYGTQFFH